MSSNLDKFKAIDDAYNFRDWESYSALLDETFCGWMMDDARPQDKARHLLAAKDFCNVSADNHVHNSPYVVAFADGDWTCTIARFTGSITGPIKSVQPTNRSFETTFATISRWVDGKIVEEHEFLDGSAILRQVVGDTNGKEIL